MGKLYLNYNIEKLKPADYNPRFINDSDLIKLKESLKLIGCCKPIIARGNVIVAGHQRTKALMSLGINTAPVYLLDKEASLYDEIRFNQLHNGTDLQGNFVCKINSDLSLGFNKIDYKYVKGDFRSEGATIRKELADLMLKYGPFGACVATLSGDVIHCNQYALACVLVGQPVTVYAIPNEKKDIYSKLLNSQYGVFSYERLPKYTFVQTFAQMFRLRGEKLKSRLYENYVIPYLSKYPDSKIIDFGSGQGDYFKLLRDRYNISEVELFRRKGQQLNLTAINQMIDKMIMSLKESQFDVTICDSVLNSVDCKQAENSVMTFLNVLTKIGGTLFVSGRAKERIDSDSKSKTQGDHRRRIEFLDSEGFTALYRQGYWFYQKFHTQEQAIKLIEKFGFKVKSYQRMSTSWQIVAIKVNTINKEEAKKAIEYEFNLPISESMRLNRDKDVLSILEYLYGSG